LENVVSSFWGAISVSPPVANLDLSATLSNAFTASAACPGLYSFRALPSAEDFDNITAGEITTEEFVTDIPMIGEHRFVSKLLPLARERE
jgi:hypothetical protein